MLQVETASNIYIYIQGEIGEGQVYNFIQVIYKYSKWFKRQIGQNRHFRLPRKGGPKAVT